MSNLIDIFLQPGKAFTALKDKPTILLPYLVVSALTAAFGVGYFLSVDPEWYTTYVLTLSGQEMTQMELQQARKFIPAAQTMAGITAVTSFLFPAVLLLLFGAYYGLVAKLTGSDLRFRNGVSLAAWSNIPAAIGALVAAIGVFGMDPQATLESLMMLNIDPLLVELPRDHPWSALAKGFSLTTLWVVFLAALGWKIWNRTGWGQAIAVAVVPQAIMLGLVAVLT